MRVLKAVILFFLMSLFCGCYEEHCEVPALEPIEISHYSDSMQTSLFSNLDFKVSDGEINYDEFTVTSDTEKLSCWHHWSCMNDDDNTELYWEEQEVIKHSITSDWISIIVRVTPSRNDDDPTLYHDEFYINIKEAVVTCCVITMVLDERNENDAIVVNNEELEFHKTIKINDRTFENVYSNKLSKGVNHKIYFSYELGVVGFYRLLDERSYNIY